MRSLIALAICAATVLVATEASPANDCRRPPRGYNCETPDLANCRCRCSSGERTARDDEDHAMCVPDDTPRLVAPPHGAIGVAAGIELVIEIPLWIDAVQLQICADIHCDGARPVDKVIPVEHGVARYALTEDLIGMNLYWRAASRRAGKVAPRWSVPRYFRTARTRIDVAGLVNVHYRWALAGANTIQGPGLTLGAIAPRSTYALGASVTGTLGGDDGRLNKMFGGQLHLQYGVPRAARFELGLFGGVAVIERRDTVRDQTWSQYLGAIELVPTAVLGLKLGKSHLVVRAGVRIGAQFERGAREPLHGTLGLDLGVSLKSE